MTEGLFILTTIFVAYVVYAIIAEQKATAKPAPAVKPETPTAKPEAQVAAVAQPKPQVAVANEKPAVAKAAAPKPAAPKAASAKPATKAVTPKTVAKPAAAKAAPAKKAAAAPAKRTGLKDPKTGDVVTAYTNYRFTKRWIKDALVAEGLLDKVYTANELNPEAETKIKEAIGKLEAMDKYKA